MDFLVLAQDPVETAAKTIPLLEQVIAGGVPLICLAIAVIAGLLSFWQMRKNNALEREYRKDIEKQADQRLAGEQAYRKDVERLLREMIERGEDSQEALQTNTAAVNSIGVALNQLTTRIEYVERIALANRANGSPPNAPAARA